MTRLVTFADGFTSAAPPDVTPGAQENFPLLNNRNTDTDLDNVAGDQLIFDPAIVKTAFALCEIERFDDDDTYRQSIEFTIAHKDGVGFFIELGMSPAGCDDMLQISAISQPWHVLLVIDPVTGAMDYRTGNMPGAGYEGTLKTIISRVLA